MKKFALLFSLLLTFASLSFATPPAQENAISASQADNAPDSQSYPLLLLRCAPINYPKYALRYELQGDTTISAIADADGKVISAEIAHSSGWRILDDAVLQAVQNCKVLDQPDMEKTPLKGTFKWRISGIDYQQPQLIAASCAASDAVHIASDEEKERGIVIGVYLDKKGVVKKMTLEWSSGTASDMEAIRLLKSCQFLPAQDEKKTLESAISIRLIADVKSKIHRDYSQF